jgi:hypothetical protein
MSVGNDPKQSAGHYFGISMLSNKGNIHSECSHIRIKREERSY